MESVARNQVYKLLHIVPRGERIAPHQRFWKFRNNLVALITFGDCEILQQYCMREQWLYLDSICRDTHVFIRLAYRSRDIRSAQILADMTRACVDPSLVCNHGPTIRAAIWAAFIWCVPFGTIFPWADSSYLTNYSECAARYHAIQSLQDCMRLSFDSRLATYCKKYEPIVWRNFDDFVMGDFDAIIDRLSGYQHVDDFISFGMFLATTRQPQIVATFMTKLHEAQQQFAAQSEAREMRCIRVEQGILRGIKECIHGYIPLNAISWNL